ncbi:hypothetical protein [Aureimonas glaciei]|uniref:Uncharacterized protein n=1 Tax=Aureimonas glaciei TaxID=1776957 RepID=A0A916YGR9_9HYPH|nr:hypothetical protein [Aureimonas glaciei]GGD43836.1 hypothetical protein GCM10011335_53090 [Aureimonas glaciei]
MTASDKTALRAQIAAAFLAELAELHGDGAVDLDLVDAWLVVTAGWSRAHFDWHADALDDAIVIARAMLDPVNFDGDEPSEPEELDVGEFVRRRLEDRDAPPMAVARMRP